MSISNIDMDNKKTVELKMTNKESFVFTYIKHQYKALDTYHAAQSIDPFLIIKVHI